jgi:uncharacterized protein YoxC
MVQWTDRERVFESGKQRNAQGSTRVRELGSDALAQVKRVTGRVGSNVEGVLQFSLERTNQLSSLIRGQMQRQLSAVGVATKVDVLNETRDSFEKLSAAIAALLDQSRRATTEVREAVHEELQRELSTLHVATKDDIAALEAKLPQASATTSKRTSRASAPPTA